MICERNNYDWRQTSQLQIILLPQFCVAIP
uniref:Uncharacterized protein n=1 Tax=Arundo donax TaxID=35708 RepID=A0A0A8ZGB9_ARUDO